MKTRHLILVALSGLLPAAAASATDIYKYRLPDGDILYTQKHTSRGKLLDVIHVEPPTPQQLASREATQRRLERQAERADALMAQRQPEPNQQDQDDTALGTEALATLPPLPTTRAPLPGERQGTAGGYSRLNEAYWARMRALGLSPQPAPEQSEEPATQMLLAQ